MDNLLKSIYTKLDLNNISEFENYLNDSGLTIENVKEKMKVEILWNQLIARKFKNQINVDENDQNTIRDGILLYIAMYNEKVTKNGEHMKEIQQRIQKLEQSTVKGVEDTEMKKYVQTLQDLGENLEYLKTAMEYNTAQIRKLERIAGSVVDSIDPSSVVDLIKKKNKQ